MATRGRPPIPIEIKRRRGRTADTDSGGRPLPRAAELVVLPQADGVPPVPFGIESDGADLWRRIWQDGLTWISPEDGSGRLRGGVPGVADDLATARRRYRATTDPKDAGAVVSLGKRLDDALSMLGFNPTARSRLGVAEVKRASALQNLIQPAQPPVDGWPPRWLTPVPAEDVERGDGELFARFGEAVCRIDKDSLGGPAAKLIVYRPWQRQLLRHLLARRPTAVAAPAGAVGMARKNGKSGKGASSAWVGLCLARTAARCTPAPPTRIRPRSCSTPPGGWFRWILSCPSCSRSTGTSSSTSKPARSTRRCRRGGVHQGGPQPPSGAVR
jgi:hypothetical protein